LVRDQVAVEDAADVARGAPARIPIIVGDQVTQVGGIALLGCAFRRIDERADLILRCAGGTAARKQKDRGERQLTYAADKRPIAAGRP
jgi:hypothetical protein